MKTRDRFVVHLVDLRDACSILDIDTERLLRQLRVSKLEREIDRLTDLIATWEAPCPGWTDAERSERLKELTDERDRLEKKRERAREGKHPNRRSK